MKSLLKIKYMCNNIYNIHINIKSYNFLRNYYHRHQINTGSVVIEDHHLSLITIFYPDIFEILSRINADKVTNKIITAIIITGQTLLNLSSA